MTSSNIFLLCFSSLSDIQIHISHILEFLNILFFNFLFFSPLIFSDFGWFQVTETSESETMEKGWLLYKRCSCVGWLTFVRADGHWERSVAARPPASGWKPCQTMGCVFSPAPHLLSKQDGRIHLPPPWVEAVWIFAKLRSQGKERHTFWKLCVWWALLMGSRKLLGKLDFRAHLA